MIPAPRFVEAGISEIDLVIGLIEEFHAIEHLPFEESVVRRGLGELFDDRRLGRVYLALDGREAVGYAVMTFGFSLEFHGRDALVDELYIQEASRGRGWGRALLGHLEEVCDGLGIRALHLEVDHANERAQRFYRAAGYRDHDRHLLTRWLGA